MAYSTTDDACTAYTFLANLATFEKWSSLFLDKRSGSVPLSADAGERKKQIISSFLARTRCLHLESRLRLALLGRPKAFCAFGEDLVVEVTKNTNKFYQHHL